MGCRQQAYLDGKVEQFWFREKMDPIFLMNVESLDDARATLNALPFVSEGLSSRTQCPAPMANISLAGTCPFRSATRARKMIAQRALVARITLDANDIASKGEGMGFAVRVG